MKRFVFAGALMLLGAGAVVAQQDVAIQQDDAMKSLARPMYGVLGRMARGQVPYDQAAVDAALNQLQDEVGKIPGVFATNPKEDVAGATYSSSPKIWQNKADFDAKVPPLAKAVADARASVKDADSLKVAFDGINGRCSDCHEVYRVRLK